MLNGDAAVNKKKGVFCIDKPSQGVALFWLDTGAQIQTLPIDVKRLKRPHQVSFTEECSTIVSSSDHGVVYVFDRRSVDTLDKLKIYTEDWIQTITVSRCCHMYFSG
jgi:hypothetical protein